MIDKMYINILGRLRRFVFPIGLCVLIISVAFTFPTQAQIVEPSRMVDWGNAGFPGTIPEVATVVNVMDYRAKGDGGSDDYPAISAAIADAPSPGAVFLTEGIYLFKSTIRLKEGIVLRGAGADKTSLICDMGGSGVNCIEILTYQHGNFMPVLKKRSRERWVQL